MDQWIAAARFVHRERTGFLSAKPELEDPWPATLPAAGLDTLSNFVGGVNFRPKNDLSFNVTVGAGVHTLYTYQWSAYLSPQYRLPWTVCGRKPVALELDTTFENYVLGNFSQATPKIDLDLTSWLPQLQIGYAFGDFDNTTSVHPTQYYQPQAIRGVTFTAVAHPLDQMYVVVSYLPANRNYIAAATSPRILSAAPSTGT